MAEQGNIDQTCSLKFQRLNLPQSGTAQNEPSIVLCDIPVDYEFNDLIANIAKQLTIDDVKEIKTRLRGDQGLKRKVCEDIKDAYELFDVLQKETLVDRDNLLFLQALLYRMNKHELFDLAVNYAQNKGNSIHFKKPPAEPPNGYTFVQIHIEGRSFSQYNRSTLEALRAHAARLMFVPPEYVVIAGIEPSNSMLITLMIQTKHVLYLKRAAEDTQSIKEWVHFGVDFIKIEGKEYFLKDQPKPETIESDTEKRLQNIFLLYEDATKKLECRDFEILQLNRKIQTFINDDKRKPETIEFEAEKRLIDTLKLYEEVKHKLECRDVEISQLKKRLQNFIYNGDIIPFTEEIPRRRRYSSGNDVDETTPGNNIECVYIRMRGNNWYKYIGGPVVMQTTGTDTSSDQEKNQMFFPNVTLQSIKRLLGNMIYYVFIYPRNVDRNIERTL